MAQIGDLVAYNKGKNIQQGIVINRALHSHTFLPILCMISKSQGGEDVVEIDEIENLSNRFLNCMGHIQAFGRHTILRQTLANLWSNLIFRRVYSIDTKMADKCKVQLFHHDGSVKTVVNPDELKGLTQDEIGRTVSFAYDRFCGKTTTTTLRQNDPFERCGIRFDSRKYRELNWEEGKPDKLIKRYSGYTIIPRCEPEVRGLVCGMVGNNEEYEWFFSASEQFYIFATCVLFGNDQFRRGGRGNPQPYSRLVKRVKCNNWLWRTQNDSAMTEEAKEAEFYTVKTEKVSAKYFHIYQLLMTYFFLNDKLNERISEWGWTFPGDRNGQEYLDLLLANFRI